MEKRLLLDRITLNSCHISPGNVERSTTVEANLAHTWLSIRDGATVAAGIAAHPIAIQFFPKSGVALADLGVRCQDVAQCDHTYILRGRIGSVWPWMGWIEVEIQFAVDLNRSLWLRIQASACC